MTQHQKCDYSVTSEFFLPNFVPLLGGSYPLVCYFSLKLLHIYAIGIIPNFNFKFCNCTSLFVTWCYVLNNYYQIYWKKLEVELHKIDTFTCQFYEAQPVLSWCAWSVTKLKTGSDGPKMARTADACMHAVTHAVIRLWCVQRSQLFALFWASLPIQWKSTHMNTFTD